jgi:hypothetical protein
MRSQRIFAAVSRNGYFCHYIKSFNMRPLLLPLLAIIALAGTNCKSGSGGGPKLMCDTVCLKDTIKFSGEEFKLKPYVYISVKDCKPDSIIWSYNGMGANRKTKFDYSTVSLNTNFVRCIFNDTSFVYLLFNDCATRRGFQIKLPFDKKQSFEMRTSGINNLDPKFSISDNLVAYTDRGNIYVLEVTTGKKAMMTFGEKVDVDYDAIHEHIDSVNVTNSRIWVNVKIKDKWTPIEKNITLEK